MGRGCGITDRFKGCRRGRGRRIRREPPLEHGRPADSTILFREIDVDDAADVSIQLGPTATVAEASDSGKAGTHDLPGIGLERDGGRPGHRGPPTREQIRETDGSRGACPLRERHRPHAERHDSAGPRMRGRGHGAGRSGEDEPSRITAAIDGAPHRVPDRRHSLPLVDQHRSRGRKDQPGIGLEHRPLGRIVESEDRPGSLFGGGGLPDAPRAFDGDGR